MLRRHLAGRDRPGRGGQGAGQFGHQVGDGGVGGRVRRPQGHSPADLEADLVDRQVEADVARQPAIGRDWPARRLQLIDIGRREDVDAAGRVERNHAVGAAGGDAGRAVQHHAATGIGRAVALRAGIQAAHQMDQLAGGNVGADDELAPGGDGDGAVDIVADDVAADVAPLGVAHLVDPAAAQQQALHIDILHAVERDGAGLAHAAVRVTRTLHHHLGRGVHQQADTGDVRAAIGFDQSAGVDPAAGLDRLPCLVDRMAAEIGLLHGGDVHVAVAAGPQHGFREQVAAGVEGLAELTTADDRADGLQPRAAGDDDVAAGAARPKAGRVDAAGRADIDPEAVAIIAGRVAVDRDVAAGVQAGVQHHLLPGIDQDRSAAIAIGVQREDGAVGAGHAARGDDAVHVHVLGALDDDGAAEVERVDGTEIGDVDAAAMLVRAAAWAGERVAGDAQPAVQRDRLADGQLALDVEEGIGLQRQRDVGAEHVDVAAGDHVLGGLQHQALVVAQAGDGSGLHHAVAGAVVHQVVAGADPGDVPEIGGLVEDRVLGLATVERVAEGGAVVFLGAGREGHGARAVDRAAEQHLVRRRQRHGAIGARDGGHDAADRDAGADGAARIDRERVRAGQVDGGVGPEAADVAVLQHQQRAAGVDVEASVHAAEVDDAGRFDGVARGDDDMAAVIQRADQANAVEDEAGAADVGGDEVGIGFRVARHVDGDRVEALYPTRDLRLLADGQRDAARGEAAVRQAGRNLDVGAGDVQQPRDDGQAAVRGLHVAAHVHDIGEQRSIVAEGRDAGVVAAQDVRVELQVVGVLHVAEQHGIAGAGAADVHLREAVRQRGQVPAGKIEAGRSLLEDAVLLVVETGLVFRRGAEDVGPGQLVRLDGERAGADDLRLAALEVHIVGGQRDVLAGLQRLDGATDKREQRTLRDQVERKIAVRDLNGDTWQSPGQHRAPVAGGQREPLDGTFPAGIGDGAVDDEARVLGTGECPLRLQRQAGRFLDVDIAHAAAGGFQCHAAKRGDDGHRLCADGVLDPRQQVGALAGDTVAAGVDQRAIGRLQPDPAGAADVRAAAARARRVDEVTAIQLDVGLVAIGTQVDEATVERGQRVLQVQRLDGLDLDIERGHVGLAGDGAADRHEAGGAEQ